MRYEAFAPAEARRIARRLELHPTPKHAGWLNTAALELGVLDRRRLAQRLPSREAGAAAAAAARWPATRNVAQVKVTWRFTTDAARTKLARPYPALRSESPRSPTSAAAAGRSGVVRS